MTSTGGGESASPTPGWRGFVRRWLPIGAAVAVGLLVLIQLVPYRVTNPPVVREPKWNSAQTERLVRAACYDCHSNETETTLWEKVAPLSWWITNHVKEGRAALNFSECRTGGGENDAAETIRGGSMPPRYYTWFGMHSGAALSASERSLLAAGISESMRGLSCGSGG